jgi:hypothetical protein
MGRQFDIEALVADLKPVRPVSQRSGVLAVLAATAFAACVVLGFYGGRADLMEGSPHPMVILRAGMLVLLGLATTVAAASAARPAVGQGQNGWLWALAAAGLMPLSATLLFGYHMMTGEPFATGAMDFHYAPWCLGLGSGSALLIGTVLVWWLRRGAPTGLNRAGWLVGLAAGSFGAFAYSLHCPSDSIYYVGLFYTLTVAVCAVVGRLIVPRLIRW